MYGDAPCTVSVSMVAVAPAAIPIPATPLVTPAALLPIFLSPLVTESNADLVLFIATSS